MLTTISSVEDSLRPIFYCHWLLGQHSQRAGGSLESRSPFILCVSTAELFSLLNLRLPPALRP